MITQIVGFLGKDAEVTEKNGKKLMRFNIAETNKVAGENVTTWVTCFYHNSELAQYLKKGKQVFVSGELTVKVYNGNPDLSLHVHSLRMLGRKDDGQE